MRMKRGTDRGVGAERKKGSHLAHKIMADVQDGRKPKACDTLKGEVVEDEADDLLDCAGCGGSGQKAQDERCWQILKVLVTGAAGNIAYSLFHYIANGDAFGKNQRICLVLLDVTPAMELLRAVVMELQDCAFDLLREIVATDREEIAFTDLDVAILIGSIPHHAGMLKKDLLKSNVRIFRSQGQALNKFSKKTVKVIVVGNPANTNCLVALKNAPTIPPENFSSLNRLGLNRAKYQIAARLSVEPKDVRNLIVWGNPSPKLYPDVNHAYFIRKCKKMSVTDGVGDSDWLQGDFIRIIQERNNTITKVRKLSSAMSAAKAISDHLRDLWVGTPEGDWTSMGVISNGNSYGVAEDLIYSFPVTIQNKTWKLVQDLAISDFSKQKMKLCTEEIVDERNQALTFLSESKL
eukprot:gi/632988337/ref/XP_007883055.1/ PREDICTED: malate dehydrogenase, cytoplasmic-like [Callorhinchus milii]